MNHTILSALKELFGKVLEVDPDQVTDDLKYKDIPQWDSITHMFLIEEIEQEFNIEINPKDILEMNSIPKIIAVLNKYQLKNQ